MTGEFDPHYIQGRYESETTKINQLSKPNQETINDFLTNYTHERKAPGLCRKYFLARALRQFAEALGDQPLTPLGTDKIRQIIKHFEQKERKEGREPNLQTWKGRIKDLRILIKWCNPKEYPNMLLELKDEMKTGNPYGPEANKKRKLRIENFLITEERFLKLLNAGNTQEKALVAVGYGMGPRAGEVLGLRRRDVLFNPENKSASIDFIESKTTPRRGILLEPTLAGFLAVWFEESPKKDPNDFVFLVQKNGFRPMTEKALSDTLHRIAVKAGLGKWKKHKTNNRFYYNQYDGEPVFWTMFRRSHVTWCLKNMKNMAVALKRTHGNESSSMAKVYSAMLFDDSNEAYAETVGLTNPKNGKALDSPKTCFKCGSRYPANASLCLKCNLSLDPTALISEQTRSEARMLELEETVRGMQLLLNAEVKRP
ncbi:MAG: site-specific integrase [Candidatus Diapherotrites archaeon]|uniref:Site-specific integrase n=1 Tax=Candidatus Iainarchaeum sp. TaxID=3101447 RepID=A0A8T4L2K1_9ARCH|nr:site-specific integrase [Candidatus Diapherotrites archaeon]